jgi:sigma-B regulation protein RsbU (phosphoserine phosphatase)
MVTEFMIGITRPILTPRGSAERTATILVVDDSPINLQVLVRTLNGTNHRILAATSGKSALDIVQRIRPDLILLDVMMPGMDGFEVCRSIKANDATRDIVIIFLSALGEVKDKVAGLQLGAVDYITKPIQAEEVLARVSNHLDVQRLQRQLRESRDELDHELASAAEMQRLILPQRLPETEALSFAAYYETSRHVGGDYYDIIRLPGDQYGVLIVDVSGHGAPSAIIMSMIRAVFHTLPVPAVDPAAVLQRINNHFRFMWGASMMATALYAVVDMPRRVMRMACCGHLPPLLFHDDAVGQLECVSTIPLLLMNVPDIPCFERSIVPGDRVLFYTDGVTECEDDNGNMYEIQGLMNAFHTSRDAPPQELMKALVADLSRFSGGREPSDDQTLLLMTVKSQ